MTDGGVPANSTIALSYINFQYINDHTPILSIDAVGGCVSDNDGMFGRRRRDVGDGYSSGAFVEIGAEEWTRQVSIM